MPLEGGDLLRDGEDVLVLGHRPESVGSTNYVAPPRGGPYKSIRTSEQGCPGAIAGDYTPREGELHAFPPREGGRDESILRGNGMLGEEAGESPRELSVHWTLGTPKWGTVMGWRPPQGDAVGRKNRAEGWRTGMVWKPGDGLEV